MKKILIVSLLAVVSLTACKSKEEKLAELGTKVHYLEKEATICARNEFVGKLTDPAEKKKCAEYKEKYEKAKAELDKFVVEAYTK